jgi:hypothetical protein
MALTGMLLADFSAFVKEASSATAALLTMEKSGGSAAKQLEKIPATVQENSSAFGKLSTEIATTFTGMVSAEAVVNAASTAFHTLTGFVEESVTAFAKQEDASNKLVASLRQHGLATPEVISQYNALATTFQNTTKYADEDIQAMESLLTLVGNVMPSQMQAALKASTDLASGLGIDLEKATMLVAKAAAGHTETLGRYGITVDAAAVQTRGLSAVLDVINDKFGGQAAAQIETYSGRLAQMANAWDNVKEALGKVIVEDPLVVAALNNLTQAAKNSDAATADASKSIADLAADFGIIDRVTADAVNGIGAYVDSLNTMATAQRMAAAVPSPFEKMARDMAAPAITAGFALNAKLLKEHEEQVRKDAQAAEEWVKANTAVNGSLVTWQDTLATVDKGLQEDIKIALSSGASQKELATAWGLTDAQIKAVVISLNDYATALTETADLEKAEIARRKEITAETTKATNQRVLDKLAADEQQKAFLAANLADAQLQDSLQLGVQATTATTVEGLKARELAAKSAYEKIANDGTASMEKIIAAQDAWKTASDATTAAVAAASTTAADTIGNAYTAHFKAAQGSFEQFQGVVVAGTAEMIAGLTSFHDSGAYVQMQKDMRDAQNARGGFYIDTGIAGTVPTQTRDSGGPVVGGQSYLIGGGKAPEVFTPGASGFVTPGGGGGSVVQNIYVTQPLGTPDAIARAVADAQIALMKGQGARLPYGA